MKLIIAEKPDLARDIAKAVCGAPDRCRIPYEGGGYRVVACAGHILELREPSDIEPELWGNRRDIDAIPILPNPWPKEVVEGKENLLAEIERGLRDCDSVINAGDPDDEGQLLIDEVLDYLGYEGRVERVYINDNLTENIRVAFTHLKPNDQARLDGEAALARSLADFTFGVNESRLISIKAGGGMSISVGRVQTPTLGLVVRRDEEIANHQVSEYYVGTAQVEVDGVPMTFEFKPDGDLLDENKRVTDKARLTEVLDALVGQEGTFEVGVSREKTPAPLPYNLTDLTADAGGRFKLTAKQVLDATQTLREEHHAITYNRSDCNYLPTAAHAQAPDVLGHAMENIGATWTLDYALQGRCFDDSAITAHTAIIPQAIEVDIDSLRPAERSVYRAIVERYAMQFAGDAQDDVSQGSIEVEGGALTHRSVTEVEPGWRSIRREEEAAEATEWLDAGEHAYRVVKTEVQTKKTRPKPPYTEATLVKDMASIAKYVTDPEIKRILLDKDKGKKGEHGGIGTSATRAAIIENLKSKGYIAIEKGKVRSTELGRAIYHVVPEDIRGADMTARWWLVQEEVRTGRKSPYALAESVAEMCEEHKTSAYNGLKVERGQRYPVVGPCPLCGADVIDKGGKVYTCSSNRYRKLDDGTWEQTAGCGYRLFKMVAGKPLTKAQAERLLKTGRTGLIKGFKSKAGKNFDAMLVLGEDGRANFEFPPRKSSSKSSSGTGARKRG